VAAWTPKRVTWTAETGCGPDGTYLLFPSRSSTQHSSTWRTSWLLILGVKVSDVVDVAAHWIAVLSIDTRDSATLISNEGRKIEVSARGMTEMVPEVWIGLGPDATKSRLRLLFEAPRNIPITRRHE
jgi:hypothetical protein